MSDERTLPLPSGGTSVLPEVAETDFPDSHLRTSKPSDDDGSTASPSAARIASSSRTSSAEATDTTTFYTSSSSSPPPSSSDPSTSSMTSALALVPPWSLTRIPARLRRKCPLYLEQALRCEEHADADDDDDDAGAQKVTESTSEEDEDVSTASGPVAPSSTSTSTPTRRTIRRPRVPPPVPVPHLTKKSRGRRVPDPTEARERAHVCAVPGCSKSFARAEHLKRHVLSLHTHEKPFACECGKTFARRDNLLQHQRVHATT